MSPTRPVLRWHGGKWKLAPWIMSHFPEHRVYVEPYGGAASVLLRKRQSYAEIYNDLDDWVVSLFRVLQRPDQAARLIELLRLTPFARTEFERSRELAECADPVEQARRLIIRSFMGFGSNANNGRLTGFRSNSNRSGTTPARDWASYPEALALIVKRFTGVTIENRPATQVMEAHDGRETLHYVDPPYLASTRSPANKYDLKHRMYRHEMTDDDHRALAECLHCLKGMVILSGYPSPLYEELFSGWHRVERAAFADGARKRVEVLWINQAAHAARLADQGFLREAAT